MYILKTALKTEPLPTWYCPWYHHLTEKFKERNQWPDFQLSISVSNVEIPFLRTLSCSDFYLHQHCLPFSSSTFTEIWSQLSSMKLYTNIRHIHLGINVYNSSYFWERSPNCSVVFLSQGHIEYWGLEVTENLNHVSHKKKLPLAGRGVTFNSSSWLQRRLPGIYECQTVDFICCQTVDFTCYQTVDFKYIQFMVCQLHLGKAVKEVV